MGVFDTMKAKAEEWIKSHPDQVEKAKRQAEHFGRHRSSGDEGRGREQGGRDSDAER